MAQASEQLMALLKPKCPCHQHRFSSRHLWPVLQPNTKMPNGPHLYLIREDKSSLKWPTAGSILSSSLISDHLPGAISDLLQPQVCLQKL